MKPLTLEEVINNIQKLIQKEGYIYAFCMILFEDFHLNIENIEEMDHRLRLSTKEVSFILGYMIQKEINFSRPENDLEIIEMKKETYKLMKEFQIALNIPFIEKLKGEIEKNNSIDSKPDFFSSGEMFVDPIFYSGN